FENGSFKPIIDSVYDWKDVVAAHEYIEANKNIGKIVLRIS
ncbi:MAG: zinc-binding dehydrogenase, partial [Bacteroidota bacterium]